MNEPDIGQPEPLTPRHLILGTAGHIDHGKSTLVKALTGVDTDRLPEEKRRGMTIELGFAELALGDVTFGIVDVPGHEKFVRTMVAGATGIDVALIVVAADDAVMPQTIEHVEILGLLGVRHAVVALTKCDLIDEETTELAEYDVQELLADTSLADAPIVRCSGTTGAGIDAIRDRLTEAAGRVTRGAGERPFRMPVDRVFSVAGRGAVVTGSVLSGRIQAGDSVDILPDGATARVRELQTHGRPADAVVAGQRAAINLQGVDKETLARGCELAAANTIIPTRRIDAHVDCLRSHRKPIKNNARVRLCIGTREVVARCVLLSDDALPPGASGYVQLRCAETVAATFGQRFIVRDENAARTAGGGIVLRAAPRRISARMTDDVAGLKELHEGTPQDRVAEVLRAARFHAPSPERIALDAGITYDDVTSTLETLVSDERVQLLGPSQSPVATQFMRAFLNRACTWLRNRHQRNPDEPGCLRETFIGYLERKSDRPIAKMLRDRLIETGEVKAMGRYICLKEFAPALSNQDEKVLAAMLDAFTAAGFQPPNESKLVTLTGATPQRIRKLLKVACALGDLAEIGGAVYLRADRAEELRSIARKLFADDGPFTLSQLRQALDTTRKFVVPLAEYLDRIGFTSRTGDKREVAATEQP